MAFAFILPLRAVQALLSIVVLGLTAYSKHSNSALTSSFSL